MQPVKVARQVTLGVAELARFSRFPAAIGAQQGGLWRAQLGTEWHQTLRMRLAASDPRWQFERTVAGVLWHQGWQFHLRGRVDQLLETPEQISLREVKTVDRQLPMDWQQVFALYPDFIYQLLLYGFLCQQPGRALELELVLVEISTGLTQVLRLEEAHWQALHAHLSEVVAALGEREDHVALLRRSLLPPPFARWRDGQEAARKQLQEALRQVREVHFEAPTGFGKTGLALECALGELLAGKVTRLIVLTGKNTGHGPVIGQLLRFRSAVPCLRILPIRSRADLRTEWESGLQLSPAEIEQRWKSGGVSATALLEESVPDLESLQALGAELGIPPWILLRLLMPYADVWVADYNYLYDPVVASLFANMPGYLPQQTFLLIDEAHNLPERVRAGFSHRFERAELQAALADLQFCRFPGKLPRELDRLLGWLKRQALCEEMDPPAHAQLADHLEAIAEAWEAVGFGMDECSEATRAWIADSVHALAAWNQPELEFLLHCPAKGVVALDCLDAAAVIAATTDRFAMALFMSATLSPWPQWLQSIGSKPDAAVRVEGHAAWLNHCFEIWIDARADTRYRQRIGTRALTAHTIGQTALSLPGCLLVFFPSYSYAEMIGAELQSTYPALRCAIQPRGLALEEQMQFLEHALLLQDVLMLILGSRFSEGIDELGGLASHAIVVSPGLPEVNAVQNARRRQLHLDPQAAFHQLYTIPGLRKVNQALGRLARAPEHRIRVLLHDKRFAADEYQQLLAPYLQAEGIIGSDAELERYWLFLANPER